MTLVCHANYYTMQKKLAGKSIAMSRSLIPRVVFLPIATVSNTIVREAIMTTMIEDVKVKMSSAKEDTTDEEEEDL